MVFMEKLNPRFHPQHFVYMRVAQEIVRTLQDNASEVELKLRAHIMRSLAKIYNTLEPGLTRRRGMTLMETGSVLLEVALKDYNNGDGIHFSHVLKQVLL